MGKYRQIFYTSRFLILFTLIALSIIGVSANHIVNKPQDDVTTSLKKRLEEVIATTDVKDLRITNKTSAFNVLDIEKTPDGIIQVLLQNDYGKSITAYKLSMGNDSTMVDALLSVHDASLAPGHSLKELMPLEVDPDLKKKGIVILAVVFDDGTSGGDAETIKEIQDYRLGEYKQMEHLNDLLNANSLLSNRDHLDIVRDMRDHMLSAPEGAGADMPDRVRAGIEDTQWRISEQIKQILGSQDEKTEKRFDAFSEYVKEKAQALRKYVKAIKANDSTQ